MKRFIRDGKVAVIVSAQHGAGWYTWNREYPDMMFDPVVVHYVLEGKFDQIQTYATLKWPDAYISQVENLEIEWVTQGHMFKITEYDGNESIELRDGNQWTVA